MMKELRTINKNLAALPQFKFPFSLHVERRELSTVKKYLSQFRPQQRRGPSSINSFKLLQLLRAHTSIPSRIMGMQIHAVIISLGFESVVFLQTALMSMYAKMRNLNDARRLFDDITHRTLVCWTAMMSAYINNRRPDKTLELFRQMQTERIEPDQVTVTIALSACADLGALDVGEWIHTYICRRRRQQQRLGEDLILSNALINMYAKCGNIGAARHLFESSDRRDVTTWTSMIMGHAMHGQAEVALALFSEMEIESIAPNSITFIAVLTACSHAGLVEEGRRYWERMDRDYSLRPKMGHYGCMVDLLCRAGHLSEAYAFIEGMPVRPNAVIWRTLLGACGLHGDVGLAARARRSLLELEPRYAGDDVAMSNAYAVVGLWDAKQGARRRTRSRRAPGCSLIEVGSRVHEFGAADMRQLEKWKIKEVLECMTSNSKALVYGQQSSNLGCGLDRERDA